MGILNINGKPYTTAVQDSRIEELKTKFSKVLHQEVQAAIMKAKDGRVELNVAALLAVVEAAYYMGREDAGG